METIENERPVVHRAAALVALEGVAHAFSTRATVAGNRDFDLRPRPGHEVTVAERRRLLLAAAGLAGARLVTLGQTHEDRIYEIAVAEAAPEDPPHGFDAAAASCPGVAIAIGTADCLPILVAERRRRAVAAVHAGWRSAALGLPAQVVSRLRERHGIDPAELVVALGPAIGPCCFEVGDEVVEALAARIPDASRWVMRRAGAKPHVDLALANRLALEAAGVPADAIESVGGCTRCDPQRYFSFRRDGAAAGRQLSVIGLVGSTASSPVSSASSTSA